MVQRILAMSTPEEFIEVSREMVTKDSRTELYNSLVASGITLLSDSLWTPEELAAVSSTEGLASALYQTETEDTPSKLLHRLQLLGHMNPGIRRYITQYIQRACV